MVLLSSVRDPLPVLVTAPSVLLPPARVMTPLFVAEAWDPPVALKVALAAFVTVPAEQLVGISNFMVYAICGCGEEVVVKLALKRIYTFAI